MSEALCVGVAEGPGSRAVGREGGADGYRKVSTYISSVASTS